MPQTASRIGAADPRMVDKIRDTYRIEIRRFMAGLLSDSGESTEWLRRRTAPPKQRTVSSSFGAAAGERVQATRYEDVRAELDDRGAPPPHIGPVRALTVAGARYSIVADRADQAVFHNDASLSGTVINLSIAAFDRFDGPLEVTDEALPWVYAILGDEWAPWVYDLGDLSGTSRGPLRPRLTTRYFDLHLSSDNTPVGRPGVTG